MRGDLSETSVADLCRGFSSAEATGAVEVESDVGQARIFFRAGNVYWAASPTPRARLGDRLVNAGLLSQEQLDEALEEQRWADERTKLGALLVDRGLVPRDAIRVFVLEQILDALFEMVRWRDGRYVFRPGELVEEKLPVDIPVDQLLVEVARRQSEWDQIQATIPDLDMVPDFVRGGSSANAALEPDEFAVLASVDGARSIRELADHLGYSEFEAARIVYGLTLLGIVDVRGDADDAEPAATDVEVDVATALEEALASGGPEGDASVAPADRPRVKLHVDDDVSDYVPPHPARAETADVAEAPDGTEPAPSDEPEVVDPADEPEVVNPADEDEVVDPADERSVDDLAAALAAALGEESAPSDDLAAALGEGSAPRDDAVPTLEGEQEPEPWVAGDDVPAPTPTADLGFFAGSTAPPSASDADLADDEFDALLSELASDPEERPSAPRTSTSVPAPAVPDADETDADETDADEIETDEIETDETDVEPEPGSADDAPAEAPSAPAEPSRAAGGSDVSEFLRELSQLALDDPPANASPGPSTPRPARREPEPAEEKAPAPSPSREEDRRAAAEKRDDRNKKRGLFGWGR